MIVAFPYNLKLFKDTDSIVTMKLIETSESTIYLWNLECCGYPYKYFKRK